MRVYRDNVLISITCNKCKKEFKVEHGIPKEECIHVEHLFGYFSQKDGQKHLFDLCEKCYDNMIAEFALPIDTEEATELL